MIVTEAAGFLGSCMISKLNQQNFNYIVANYHIPNNEQAQNLEGKKIQQQISLEKLPEWLGSNNEMIEFIFHLNYKSQNAVYHQNTSETQSFDLLKELWRQCVDYQIPLIFSFDHSMNETIEKWIASQEKAPFFWVGLQLPNIYGPNEYYLKDRASFIYQTYHHQTDINNLPQTSDWVYVKDVVGVAYFLMHNRQHSGFYPIETGRQYTAEEVKQCIADVSKKPVTESQQNFIPEKLQSIGYDQPVYSLAHGISDYIHEYLKTNKSY